MRHFTKLFILFFIIILSGTLVAEKVAVLEEVGRPDSIVSGNGCFYVSENTTIYIYDSKTYKYKGKFGKKGEGPGEIKKAPFGGSLFIYPFNNKVYVSSMAKLSIFSKDGKFEKEYKTSPFDANYPFKDKYITFSTKIIEGKKAPVLAVYLSDKKFKRIGPIYITDIEIGPNAGFNFPFTSILAIPFKDKIYVVDGLNGFSIKIFDQKGKEIDGFKKSFRSEKVSGEYKDKTVKWFKNDPSWKNIYGFFKNRIKYKKVFPPIYRMEVSDNRIYIFTSKIQKELRECIVFDLKGKKMKTLFLPVKQVYGMDFNQKSVINKDGFFQLRENEDDEVIELHKIKL